MIKFFLGNFLKAFLVAFVVMIGFAYLLDKLSNDSLDINTYGIIVFSVSGVLFLFLLFKYMRKDIIQDLKNKNDLKLKKEVEEVGILKTILNGSKA